MKLQNLEKTCLNRFLGRCKTCKVDYDPTHYPNNYNCKNYYEISVFRTEVKEK